MHIEMASNRGLQRETKTTLGASDNIRNKIAAGTPHLITLAELHDGFGAMPPYTAYLGIDADGSPASIDLSNPRSGSILLIGEKMAWHVAKTILHSAVHFSSPEQVQIYTLGVKQQTLYSGTRKPHHLEIIGNDGIGHIISLITSRSKSRVKTPVIVYLIAHIPKLYNRDQKEKVRYALRFAPPIGIVPIVIGNESDNILPFGTVITFNPNRSMYSAKVGNQPPIDYYPISLHIYNKPGFVVTRPQFRLRRE